MGKMAYVFTAVAAFLILFFPRRAALLLPIWATLTPKALLLIDVSSLPVVSVYRALCVVLLASFVLHMLIARRLKSRRLPFTSAFALLFIVSAISTLANGGSDNSGLLSLFVLFLEVLAPASIFAFYLAPMDEAALRLLFKKYVIYFAALAIYASAAYLIGFNPYILFIQSTTDTGRVVAQTYVETLRGARAQGTISHPITFGAVMSMTLLLYFIVRLKAPFKLRQYWGAGAFAAIVMLSVLLTNSRSPLILFVLAIGAFVFSQGLVRATRSVLFLSVVFVAAFSLSTEVQDATFSVVNIINPEVGEQQNGSDLGMRGRQLAVSMRYFDQSPLWGNGLDATRSIVASGREPDLYDSESIVFKLLIDQGAIGIAAYLLFFVLIWYRTNKAISSPESRGLFLGLSAGYVAFAIATGFMDTLHHYLFIATFVFYYFRLSAEPEARSQSASASNLGGQPIAVA